MIEFDFARLQLLPIMLGNRIRWLALTKTPLLLLIDVGSEFGEPTGRSSPLSLGFKLSTVIFIFYFLF